MKIWLLREAEEDLILGYQFYEKQQHGLGRYFLDSIYSDIESLKIYAGVHRKYFDKFRLLSKRFPYGIYYQIDEQNVYVYAILDMRQNPKSLNERLDS